MGLFDDIFDFDYDGKVDDFERVLGYTVFPEATFNFFGEENPGSITFDMDTGGDDFDLDEDNLAELHDSRQPESRMERRGTAKSIASDISDLLMELETMLSRIQDAKSDLEALLDTERDILLDLPDCLSCSDYESEIESTVDALTDAINCLDTSDSNLYDSISELEAAAHALDMIDY